MKELRSNYLKHMRLPDKESRMNMDSPKVEDKLDIHNEANPARGPA